MDPVLELSTLSASYLWALFDVLPDAKSAESIQDLRIDKLEQCAGLRADIPEAQNSFDFALYGRLEGIATRRPGDGWSHYKHDSPVAKWYPGKRVREAYAESKSRLREFRTVPEGRAVCQRAHVRFGQFKQHATALINIFGGIELRRKTGADIFKSVDDLARRIHLELLKQPAIRSKVACALDYAPVLLRAFEDVPNGKKDFDTRWKHVLDDPAYPCELIKVCRKGNLAIPFSLVLQEELDEIDRLRQDRGIPQPKNGNVPVVERAFHSGLIGLALSGGGIRSATFNLGVLQGLANKNWLPAIDYLSTVSGGGYIGAWLVAWIKRCGSVKAVQQSLGGHALAPPVGSDAKGITATAPQRSRIDPGSEHVRPIRLLREFSNYLTPQVGAFSADSWTMIAVWARNTALNLLLLTLFLMAVLLLPRLLGSVYIYGDIVLCFTMATACLAFAAVFSGRNLHTFSPRDDDQSERGDTPFVVVASIVTPVMIAAVFGAQALWFAGFAAREGWSVFLWSLGLLTGSLLLTALVAGEGRTKQSTVSETERWFTALKRGAPWTIAASLVAGAGGAAIVAAVYKLLVPTLLLETRRGIWLDLAFGPVVILAVLGFTITLYLGLEGLALHDERREWWSRLAAWLGLFGAGWAVVATISYFSPYTVAALATAKAGAVGAVWSALTALGVWLAQGGKSNGINLPFDRNVITSAVIKASPFLFIGGYLVLVAMLTHGLLLLVPRVLKVSQLHTVLDPLPFALQRYVDTYWAFMDPRPDWPLYLIAFLLVLSLLIASRVDINEFSMHNFYKNRLVRAYLGASRARINRRPNAFTGLDMQDDIKLWRFRHEDQSQPTDAWTNCRASYCGPYPIINTTLNMTAGDELAWQERKGQSFVFTPLYCGYDFASKQTVAARAVREQFGFRPTNAIAAGREDDGSKGLLATMWRGRTHDDCGLTIGTAVAISGAAANPNAGYHTSPGVAFLLTIFNARLGWWIGNTRLANWRQSSPAIGLFYLLSELFGFSGVDRDFVQLSDGGHFDNMGLYELVRRRCRFIIVCDAEQDDRYSMNGLAGAIRKCRVDFGVIIDLNIEAIKKQKRGIADAHTTSGTIFYPEEGTPGRIVYIKASITGDEPVDVTQYRSRFKEFPHQTTADQFFDESQFESYRALGQHIVACGFPDWVEPPDGTTFGKHVESLLDEKWPPPRTPGALKEA